MKPTTRPRILLVEDDPVSRAFLSAALEALPAQVDAAASCGQARQCVQVMPDHALWLIDAHLPDGGGAELLASLRAAAPRTPALAHTASTQRADLDALLAAGFLEVLVKPIAARALQGAVGRVLGLAPAPADEVAPAPCGKLPDWDDAAALAALKGEPAHVAALRRLFLGELPGQRQAVAAALAAGAVDRAGSELHRLRASCGFVGAARLGAAVQALQAAPHSDAARRRFEEAADDLLAAAATAAR
ncbi:response regulator [Cognatiluteimonas weifangensis]|uniref:Response regulator n=1 Tax=Cognatiluteimonas weifangensis TaxID=2303539 RepID=A0A372DK61_9GAMM|nr:response regulator [Luteimonas weifangensis]RFP59988.1 response regulator [Luteimonas weifangensis]